MRKRISHVLIFLLLLIAAFSVYSYGIADLPHRDDTSFMLERTFADSNWDWFWHSLSFTRERVLRQGDTFLFRPLHMAVLAIKDILFRNNFFASGAINIFFMSLAGFSLYLFASRLVRRTVAVAIALLFMVQHAGIEMVVWGHISPYLLALTFFGLGLASIMDSTTESLKPLILAGTLFLIGALFHEIIILALVFTAAVLLYAHLRARGKGSESSVPVKSYLVWAIALPVLVYLSLDIADFIYRGAPQRYDVLYTGLEKLPSAVMAAPGAAVIAFIAPHVVRLNILAGAFAWNFSGWMSLIVGMGTLASIAIVPGIYANLRRLGKGEGSPLNITALLALFMFLGFIIGVGYGRLYTREIAYMYASTYYYSVTAYVFCLLIAVGLNRLASRHDRSRLAVLAGRVAIVAIVALVALNAAMTIKTLKQDWTHRYEPAKLQYEAGKALARQADKYCLASFISPASNRLQSALLRGYACAPADSRTPVNISPGPDKSLWFVEVSKNTISGARPVALSKASASARDFEMLETYYSIQGLSDDMELLLSDEEYDAPDLSLTLKQGLNAAVVFGYRDPGNFAAFRIDGPLVYGRSMSEGKLGGIENDNALPSVRPEYRIEVRHADRFVYLFVDGYLVSLLPSDIERKGRVGVFLQKSASGGTEVSDFMAGPSGGINAPVYTPIEQITAPPRQAGNI